MKRKIIIMVLAISLLTGCRTTKKSEEIPANGLMTVVDKTIGYTIYIHDETGVMYFCRDSGYGNSVCVMLDVDGKPLLYQQEMVR